jgi:hypothetical protein
MTFASVPAPMNGAAGQIVQPVLLEANPSASFRKKIFRVRKLDAARKPL